jgi:hypothetical protein
LTKILTPGREATIEERTRSSIQLQKLANSKGWETKIGYSQFQEEDKIFKTGAKAGKTQPGKIVENVWCQGYKEGKIFTAVWHNNKLDHVLYGKQLISIKQLKEEKL